MSYPVKCPYCNREFDSHDSLADSKADLRDHVEIEYPNGDEGEVV